MKKKAIITITLMVLLDLISELVKGDAKLLFACLIMGLFVYLAVATFGWLFPND